MVAASTSTVNDGAVTIFVVVVLAACALYMAPTIVAIARRVPNAGSVAAINLLLGWSLVGWAMSWALALRSRPRAFRVPPAARSATPPGWYPDPIRGSRLRFWSGDEWTDAVVDVPAHAT